MSSYLRKLVSKLNPAHPLFEFIRLMHKAGYSEAEMERRVREASTDSRGNYNDPLIDLTEEEEDE